MDGYSRHEQKKRDLQVSKEGSEGSKGWVDRKEVLLYTPTYVHSVIVHYMRIKFAFRL